MHDAAGGTAARVRDDEEQVDGDDARGVAAKGYWELNFQHIRQAYTARRDIPSKSFLA